MAEWPALPLPGGIHSRFVDGVNGLRVHLLEAGERGRPALLLLHGFPERTFSWRKLMPLLAAGWHMIAPDQRDWGRTNCRAGTRRSCRKCPSTT